MSYRQDLNAANQLIRGHDGPWNGIDGEAVARMRAQNRFRTGLDIARYCAKIMRDDMAAYDADPANYTQSLGCWHGFIGQQKMISIKKHFGDTRGRYLYLSGWMIAALRSDFGPLPDQSMHEKTSVPALIEELYTFLKQADARELGGLFRELDKARAAGDKAKEIALLGDKLCHVHLSDCDGKVHGDLPPGRGVVPIIDYLRAIRDTGYDGTVSIELEYSPEPERIVEWVREAYEKTAATMAVLGCRG